MFVLDMGGGTLKTVRHLSVFTEEVIIAAVKCSDEYKEFILILHKIVLTLLTFTGQTKRRCFSNCTDVLRKCLCSEFCLKMNASI